MGGKKFLLGFVVLVVMALSITGVAACNGGGQGVPFEGNVLIKDVKLTDGNTTVDFNGILNIDTPYLDPALTFGVDTVVVLNAVVEVTNTNQLQSFDYLDLESADVLPTITPGPPICDEVFGYALVINEANIVSCSFPAGCP